MLLFYFYLYFIFNYLHLCFCFVTFYILFSSPIKGAATSRKEKLVKNTILVLLIWNLHSIFPWWFLTLCIAKWKSDQTSMMSLTSYVAMTSIIEIQIWNLVWLNLRSLLTNDHLTFCDYLHQSWNMKSWFCLPGKILIFTYKTMFLV